MSTVDLLTRADVPAELHADAMRVIDGARVRAKGLLWHKIKTRYLRASEIADLLAWDAERLVDVRPDLADWDIAPMVNITAHGDNAPWIPTPDGGRPAPGRWLNADPASDEYRNAVAANYAGAAQEAVRTFDADTWAVITMSHQSGQLRCRVNGGAWASTASGTTDAVGGIAAIATSPSMTLGMELAHLATANTAQTDAAISAVERWIANDLGITPWW